MKICNKCDQWKKLEQFGKDKYKKDGLNQYCKECIRKRSSEQRENNPTYFRNYAEKYRAINREILREKSNKTFQSDKDKYRAEGRQSYHRHKEEISQRRKEKRQSPEARDKARIRMREWRSKNKNEFGNSVRKWQIKNREKINSHAKVHRAVENGLLIRSKFCEECGKLSKTEGHHEDYSKPLDVKWLCRLCHASIIRKL